LRVRLGASHLHTAEGDAGGVRGESTTVTPEPESGMLREGLDAVLVIAMLPVALPPVLGANVAVNDALCPLLRVVGRVRPLRLKPVPLAEACVMVTLDVPPFVRVTVCA
jgi:hypothetical protein